MGPLHLRFILSKTMSYDFALYTQSSQVFIARCTFSQGYQDAGKYIFWCFAFGIEGRLTFGARSAGDP